MERWKQILGALRPVLFIGITIACCALVAGLGLRLADKYSLTTSTEQVPLTFLSIGGEEVGLPERGRTVQGSGWTLRNTRGSYTLTLSGLLLQDVPEGICVEGDLTIYLKKDTASWIRTEGAGIRKGSGTLRIQGEGSLDIDSQTVGILGREAGDGEERPSVLRLEGGVLSVKGDSQALCDETVELAGRKGALTPEEQKETEIRLDLTSL